MFGDRLINSQDRDWFAGMVEEKVKEHFSVEYAKARGPHEVSKSVMLFGDSVGEMHPSESYNTRSNPPTYAIHSRAHPAMNERC